MDCLICNKRIEMGEYVFVGSVSVFSGPGEYDFDHTNAEVDMEGVIHLCCLESPTQAATIPNTAICKVVESVIQRSNALELIGDTE